jgi:hypothetical protein
MLSRITEVTRSHKNLILEEHPGIGTLRLLNKLIAFSPSIVYGVTGEPYGNFASAFVSLTWAVLWSIAIAPILVPSVMIDSWLDKRNGVVQ